MDTSAQDCNCSTHHLCMQVLNVSGCKRITNEGVSAIAAACPNIVDLDLTRYVLSTSRRVCRKLAANDAASARTMWM